MKKTYIKPTTEAMAIAVQQMTAATAGIDFSGDGSTGGGSLNDEFATEPFSGSWFNLF